VHSAIGETRNYRGQLYKCVDAFPHVTRDERNVDLLVIRSRCADCWQTFEFRVTLYSFRRRRLRRRCEECRRPGVPVGPVRRKRTTFTEISPIQRQMLQVLIDLAEEQRDRVSRDAYGWVRAKDRIRALVEQNVLSKSDVIGRGSYYHMRQDLIRRKKIERMGPAVRAL
jgi:hypothetical protein